MTLDDRTVYARSWAELQDVLFEDSWNEHIQRHRSRFLFRGHGRNDFDLTPGLTRLGPRHVVLERHLLRNFKKYAQSYVNEAENLPDTFWHWMTLAQHHGLPTRLLDWTYSPLVAAHFACCDLADFDQDGVVWKIDFDAVHEQLPESLKACLSEQGAHVFTAEMLSGEIVDLEDLANADTGKDGQLLFFEPPSLNARIVNQFACLSVQLGPCQSLRDWLEHNKPHWTKVVIAKGAKWEIRDKLDQSNISERVLFPGLDGLCSWLARQYVPRA